MKQIPTLERLKYKLNQPQTPMTHTSTGRPSHSKHLIHISRYQPVHTPTDFVKHHTPLSLFCLCVHTTPHSPLDIHVVVVFWC